MVGGHHMSRHIVLAHIINHANVHVQGTSTTSFCSSKCKYATQIWFPPLSSLKL